MLYHLLFPLSEYVTGFNVFRYITFRVAAATLTALFISFLVGPWLIRRLAALRIGQPIREIGPDHQSKEGTPTMGGLLVLLSLLISVLLWSELDNRFVWIVLGLTTAYGIIGFIDDYQKVVKRSSDGISARVKILWEIALALLVALAIFTDPAFDISLTTWKENGSRLTGQGERLHGHRFWLARDGSRSRAGSLGVVAGWRDRLQRGCARPRARRLASSSLVRT